MCKLIKNIQLHKEQHIFTFVGRPGVIEISNSPYLYIAIQYQSPC